MLSSNVAVDFAKDSNVSVRVLSYSSKMINNSMMRLSAYMNVPFKKPGTLIKLMFNIDLKVGTISNMLNKMSPFEKVVFSGI